MRDVRQRTGCSKRVYTALELASQSHTSEHSQNRLAWLGPVMISLVDVSICTQLRGRLYSRPISEKSRTVIARCRLPGPFNVYTVRSRSSERSIHRRGNGQTLERLPVGGHCWIFNFKLHGLRARSGFAISSILPSECCDPLRSVTTRAEIRSYICLPLPSIADSITASGHGSD